MNNKMKTLHLDSHHTVSSPPVSSHSQQKMIAFTLALQDFLFFFFFYNRRIWSFLMRDFTAVFPQCAAPQLWSLFLSLRLSSCFCLSLCFIFLPALSKWEPWLQKSSYVNQTRLGKWCQSSVMWLIMLSMRVRPLKQKLGFNFGAFWPFKVLLREGIVSWWSSQFNLILSQWRFDDVSMVPCLWRWR